MKALLALLRSEPALIGGTLTAALALAVAFGLQLTAGQTGAITAAAAALTALIVRSQVTPTSAPVFPSKTQTGIPVSPAAWTTPPPDPPAA